jgi:hypothetical protein
MELVILIGVRFRTRDVWIVPPTGEFPHVLRQPLADLSAKSLFLGRIEEIHLLPPSGPFNIDPAG